MSTRRILPPVLRLGLALVALSLVPTSPAEAQDTVAPTVALAWPVAGTTLVGPVTVSVTASDDVGVAGLQFLLDGLPLGDGVPGPPGTWTLTWDATTALDGNHTLAAVARDAAGNIGTASALVTVWAFSSRQAATFTGRPLPIIRNRLGRMPHDYVWAGTQPGGPVVSTGYVTLDRDYLVYHDVDWFLAHHPDWLVYACDGDTPTTPIRYWADPQLGIDITNAEVRDYVYDVVVRAYMNWGLDGIALDNFSFYNHWGRCGAKDKHGKFHKRYSGDFVDDLFAEDVQDWISWLADRVHQDGGLIAINVIDLLHPDFERLAEKMDLVYFEAGGFIATRCRPAWVDAAWERRFLALRKVAVERALVIQDETCDYMSQLTPELVAWDAANFFLLRGDRSYFAMTQSYAVRPLTDPDYDGPELSAPLGEALEDPVQQGILWTRRYENGFVVVNPTSAQSATLDLGRHEFRDVYGRVFTRDLVIPPASGWILLGGGLNQIFADVPVDYWAAPWILALFRAGVTGGCAAAPLLYCPQAAVTREQMAVFLLKAQMGAGYAPPSCGTLPFGDVGCASVFAPWIHELVARGITAGCGDANYCPDRVVTREQMAVFLLKAQLGAGYSPPPCTTASFADVDCSSPFAPWIYDLVARGITSGCGAATYCPGSPVSRAEMAVFLVKTFGLPLQ
jgi:hypothetical protein